MCGKSESRILTYAIARRAYQQTLTRVDSWGVHMTRPGITAPELMFLTLAAAGIIGIIGVGLQLFFRVAG
jgi:hypothetical protein